MISSKGSCFFLTNHQHCPTLHASSWHWFIVCLSLLSLSAHLIFHTDPSSTSLFLHSVYIQAYIYKKPSSPSTFSPENVLGDEGKERLRTARRGCERLKVFVF